MELSTDNDIRINSAFHDVRKRVPVDILHGLVEQFAACPDVMAVLAATKCEEHAILGTMVMAFVAGCRYMEANPHEEVQ